MTKINYLSSTVLKERYEDFKKVIHSRDFGNKFWMKLFTHIIAPHCTTGSQTMINDATPDIARTPHTFIKRIGCPDQRVGCVIYAEEAVANAIMEWLSNALHLKTATVTMSLSPTILKNRCINQLFYNQGKVDTSTKLFSECALHLPQCNRRVLTNNDGPLPQL